MRIKPHCWDRLRKCVRRVHDVRASGFGPDVSEHQRLSGMRDAAQVALAADLPQFLCNAESLVHCRPAWRLTSDMATQLRKQDCAALPKNSSSFLMLPLEEKPLLDFGVYFNRMQRRSSRVRALKRGRYADKRNADNKQLESQRVSVAKCADLLPSFEKANLDLKKHITKTS